MSAPEARRYRAVTDHAESGTRRGLLYDALPTDLRVRAGFLVPHEPATKPAPKPRKKATSRTA